MDKNKIIEIHLTEPVEPTSLKTLDENLEDFIGPAGRMLSGSKTMYRNAHPDHLVFFNACIFDAIGRQIWWGDIDLTLDWQKLQAASVKLNKTLYVTHEHPFRWDGITKEQQETADRYIAGKDEDNKYADVFSFRGK